MSSDNVHILWRLAAQRGLSFGESTSREPAEASYTTAVSTEAWSRHGCRGVPQILCCKRMSCRRAELKPKAITDPWWLAPTRLTWLQQKATVVPRSRWMRDSEFVAVGQQRRYLCEPHVALCSNCVHGVLGKCTFLRRRQRTCDCGEPPSQRGHKSTDTRRNASMW